MTRLNVGHELHGVEESDLLGLLCHTHPRLVTTRARRFLTFMSCSLHTAIEGRPYAGRRSVSGVKRLTGALAGQYRLRTGDYRVQFRVFEGAIVIVTIGHRDRFYDR